MVQVERVVNIGYHQHWNAVLTPAAKPIGISSASKFAIVLQPIAKGSTKSFISLRKLFLYSYVANSITF